MFLLIAQNFFFWANNHNMNHEQFVSVINVLKGKTETDSHKLGIFHCRLTADVQLFFHNRFLTTKI